VDYDENGDEITDGQAFLTWQRVDVPEGLAALVESVSAYMWLELAILR